MLVMLTLTLTLMLVFTLICADLVNSLLIPLNKCRKQTLYAPWKCEDER